MAPFKGAFQTTTLAQVIRILSGRRLLKFPDEINVPEQYSQDRASKGRFQQERQQEEPGQNNSNGSDSDDALRETSSTETLRDENNGAIVNTEKPKRGSQGDAQREEQAATGNGNNKEGQQQASRDDPESGKDQNLVDWYGDDDPENPYNWSTAYKSFVAIQVAVLTFSVYVGSSIYSSGISGPNPDSIVNVFGVSVTSATVGLTVFVLGYGVGPMLWSPLTEFPVIGRLPVYMATLFIFVALQFPTIYAPNIQTLLAMRFMAGFFGSPALAVGGASMGDMFRPKHLAYAIGVWGCGAICGPVLGPLLGGFTYQAKGWTWPLWTLTWMSGSAFVFLAIFFPETSSKTILYRRKIRLQRLTGNKDLTTQAELDAADTPPSQIVKNTLFRPFVLFFEPILLVFNFYLALIYGLLYVWFESFPLVFEGVHGFNPGESGLAFMGIFVGAWLACGCFCIYIKIKLEPIFDENDGVIPNPEYRLYPSIIAAFCIPIAMFWFRLDGPSTDDQSPIIMTSFFGIGGFILFQCIFAYLSDVYAKEIGSVLTLNDLCRSSVGGGFPLFASALFSHLGIGGGNSLLGGIACLFIPAPFLFIKYGKAIRGKSKYAVHG